MRSASSFAHCTRYPPFQWGRAQKRRRLEEASTHDANGYQATTSDRCFCKYLVYQVLSGVSVSQDTLCPMTPPHPRGLRDVSVGCGTPGQKRWEGELALTGSVKTTIHSTSRRFRAPEHLVPERTDYRAR